MGWEVVFALMLFCMVASITPGPNNVMLLSSGATFGLRRTVPHVLGISTGLAAMVLVLGFGIGSVAQRLPWLHDALQIVSAVYLLWLAWRIATSEPDLDAKGTAAKPLRTIDSAAFQWVNPKAWAMVLGAVASFARPGHFGADVPTIALVLIVVGLPCITLWAGAGSVLRRFLRQPRILRAFNVSMALLLAASIVPGLIELASS